ncbi:U1 small nuclear ribonucleoprotein C [Elysia marginata]|uniref:U1 small nuclear ribonucleoprotein C n=1 Tax=Elysia marginata TaxID=1093978 RepID=A0AAV4EVA2_9GAST|nr:U1 small nuclear ribonucleoprotein C [Elysia marginata]
MCDCTDSQFKLQPSVRKTHCNGRKHKENVRLYYQKWLEEQVQKLVDDTTAAYQAGKITANPFTGGPGGPGGAPPGPGGAMIPPPGARK